jgi:hypothetical protein
MHESDNPDVQIVKPQNFPQKFPFFAGRVYTLELASPAIRQRILVDNPARLYGF